jgi:hypothetical protein
MSGQRVKLNSGKNPKNNKIEVTMDWKYVQEMPLSYKRLMAILLVQQRPDEDSGDKQK